LLIDNRLGQAGEFRWAELHAAGPNPLDNGAEDRVGFLKVRDCSSHGS
jgi:hypothetical protein